MAKHKEIKESLARDGGTKVSIEEWTKQTRKHNAIFFYKSIQIYYHIFYDCRRRLTIVGFISIRSTTFTFTLVPKHHLNGIWGLENVRSIGKTEIWGNGTAGQGTIRYRKKKLCASTGNVTYFEEEKRSRCTKASHVCVSLIREQTSWEGEVGKSKLLEWRDKQDLE